MIRRAATTTTTTTTAMIAGRRRTAPLPSLSNRAPFRIVGRPHRRQPFPAPFAASARSGSAWRTLSTEIRAQTAAAAAANAAMASESSASGAAAAAAAKKKKDEPNLFLDNLGKIFLTAIATVIVTLVRSSYNTSNRHLVRDRIEEIAAIDPKEIEEFREANSELTPDAFRRILSVYYEEFAGSGSGSGGGDDHHPGPTSSYDEFVFAVRKIMATRFPDRGESFTIELGHYLDRIIVDVLQQRGGPGASSSSSSSSAVGEPDELPVALYFTAMACAVNGSVSDRIRILHELLSTDEGYRRSAIVTDGLDTDAAAAGSVELASVRAAVGYLQSTWQLPPDTQIVPTERKYPTQLWRRATPDDMVPDAGFEPDADGGNGNGDGGDVAGVDLVEFAAILRTKSVCAWGECYMKWKPGAGEFEAAPSPTAVSAGSGG